MLYRKSLQLASALQIALSGPYPMMFVDGAVAVWGISNVQTLDLYLLQEVSTPTDLRGTCGFVPHVDWYGDELNLLMILCYNGDDNSCRNGGRPQVGR